MYKDRGESYLRILNQDVLNGHGNVEGRRIVTDLLEAGLEAADPYYNAKKLLRVSGNKLIIGCADFDPLGSPRTGEDTYLLGEEIDRVFIFGAGKGIWRAIQALEDQLGDWLTGGHVILKWGDSVREGSRVDVSFGGHPVPDAACAEGCRAMLEKIRSAHLTERDIVFTVIGNGVSSLLTLPPDGVSLEDVQQITRIIQVELGYSTIDLNRVRNQVDQLKGGRITRHLYPAKMYHIVTIDVNEKNRFNLQGYRAVTETNSWLHTLPDMTTCEGAEAFLRSNDIWDRMPQSVRHYLESEGRQNPVLSLQEFQRYDARIFGIMPHEKGFVPRIMELSRQFGYEPHWMTKQLFLESGIVSQTACSIAKNILEEQQPFRAPCLLLFAGELLVTAGKHAGIGGRNQEFCLTAATCISGRRRIVVGSADTDGTDGPGGRFNEDAWAQGCRGLSGGIVDGYTMDRAKELGLDVAQALRRHDTSDTLWKLDSGLWATQNISINDIILVLIMDHDG